MVRGLLEKSYDRGGLTRAELTWIIGEVIFERKWDTKYMS